MSVVSWLCLGALVALTTACVGVVLAQLRSIRTTPSKDLQPLLKTLRRAPREQRVALAVSGTDAASWEGRWLRQLGPEVPPHEQIDAVSEAVGEAAALFDTRSRWGMVVVRIQISGGLLFAALALIQSERAIAGIVLGIGVVGALAVAATSRQATLEEHRRRADIDALVEVLGFLERAPREPSRAAARRGRAKLDR